MSPPYCPECHNMIEEDKKHICIVFVNGYPTVGDNHLKTDFEIKEVNRFIK